MPNPKTNYLKSYVSIPQYAKSLGISRIAVYKKVKAGVIPAKKIGRNYVIPVDLSPATLQNITIKNHISLPKLAQRLGLSRVAVYNKVKRGEIKAEKIGRNFVVPAEEYAAPQPIVEKRSLIKVKAFMSIPELAKEMGLSRIAVYKKVRSGQVKAEKIGRNYSVMKQEIFSVMPKEKLTKAKVSPDRQSIPEAAKEMGISRFKLYQMVKKGIVKAARIGRNYCIEKGSYEGRGTRDVGRSKNK